jgi:lipid II:glycine glycyltransferase (peptidoglycan interpeptide bridge formation enzyme)
MFGMSRQAHREKMPNHLLQWEAMRRLRALGVSEYDLWGAPDDFTEQDALWGVYRFKEGLGGQVVRHLGAWDLPVQPLYYQLYTRILPRFLGILRRRGKRRTRRDVQS